MPQQPGNPRRTNPFGARPVQRLGQSRRVNRVPLIAGAVVLVLVAVLGVRFCMNSLEEKRLREEAEAAAAAEAAKPKPSFTLLEANLDSFPGDAELTAFTMAEHDKKPKVKAARLETIQSAIDTIKQTADVGFVFFDTGTGRGITYNADVEIYGASTYKAPFALYVCERLVETGRVSLSDTIRGRTRGTVKGLVEDSILWSSNDAFRTLHMNYNDVAYQDWIATMGVTEAPLDEGWFPTYSARSSAKIWREMAGYLDFGTETSNWLKDLLSRTEKSFIRDGVGDEKTTVYDKAGWIADGEGYNSVSDAAVIERGNDRYVMSIMCSLPFSDRNAANVAALADALFAARKDLKWEK